MNQEDIQIVNTKSNINQILISYSDVEDIVMLCHDSFNLSKLYNYKIHSQGFTKLCSVSAWLTAIEYLRQINGLQFYSISRYYQYYFARVMSNKEKENTGVELVSVIDSINTYGSMYESEYDNEIDVKPTDDHMIKAKQKILSQFQLIVMQINVNVFKVVLSIFKQPIVASVKFNSVELLNSNKNVFKDTSIFNCCHAVCIIGYDDNDNTFIFQNSYGTLWHDKGFGRLHYSYLDNINEAYALNKTCVKSEESNEEICDETVYQLLLDEVL